MIKIACCQYQIEKLANWDAYVKKIEPLVKNASQAGAQLLMLPEYAGIEIAGYHADDFALYAAIQPKLSAYQDLFKKLAQQYQIYIQAGSIIEAIADNQYVNRAYFFAPNGMVAHQDKLQLIEFEKELKILKQGSTQTVFDTALGKIGIAICYDSEFPEIVRQLVAAGAWLILVPSYTVSTAAYHRVFLSCRARALENQCYVACTFIAGEIDIFDPAEQAIGQAGVFGPVEHGYSDDGVVAQGKLNQVEMITAEISPEQLDKIRKKGKVHLFEDAKECKTLLSHPARLIKF